MIIRDLLKKYEKEILVIKIMAVKGMTPRKFYLLYEEFKDLKKIWNFVKKEHQLSFKFHNNCRINTINNALFNMENPDSNYAENKNDNNIDLEIYNQKNTNLKSYNGNSKNYSSYINELDFWVKNQLIRLEEMRAKTMLFDNKDYPPLLKEILYPPPILFYKGEKLTNFKQAISVVGSRRATNYGKKVTYQLANQLSSLGITIVSGFARGIDTAAHIGAKDEIGKTIAIFGNGLDICYPKENKDLYNELINKGSIVSEFPFGTPPERLNFPRRNRLISGISYGVVIVEAGERSGALITANFALNQGREVFAVPGEIFNENSIGVNRLIQDGAKLVTSVDDILEEFGLIVKNIKDYETRRREKGKEIKKEIQSKKSLNIDSLIKNLPEEERNVYLKLDDFPQHIDEIAKKCNLDIAKIGDILTLLELKDIINHHPGNRYSTKFIKNI